uniref:Uncharacterized protein n=1 Tax=Rhizophora mucronata TaxID=61149 RepID=A0A2P2Q673_RHIMU
MDRSGNVHDLSAYILPLANLIEIQIGNPPQVVIHLVDNQCIDQVAK